MAAAAGLRNQHKNSFLLDNNDDPASVAETKTTADEYVGLDDPQMPDLEDPEMESDDSDPEESHEETHEGSDPEKSYAETHEMSDHEVSGHEESYEETNEVSYEEQPGMSGNVSHIPKMNSDELMAKIYKGINDLKLEVNQISSKLDNALTENVEQDKRIKELEEKSCLLENDLELANQKISSLRLQNETCQERVNQLDNYIKRSNLIFRGVPESDHEDCEGKLRQILVTKLQLNDAENFRFERCHRMNVRFKPRPIICRFNYFPDRNAVWQAKKLLKGTKIVIDEDFAPEVVERRKSLLPIMKRARELKHRAFIVVDRLHIDDRVYNVNNLHMLPPELDPAKLSTKTIGDITAFCSKASPLSNFFNASFKLDKHSYVSVEQYLQSHKATVAQKPELAAKIRATNSPIQCKKLGDSIELDLSEWLPEAKNALTRACMAKFVQNERARAFLLETGNNTLAEATNDSRWGIGLTLSSDKLTNKALWGSNIFGNILMGVRDRIRQSHI